MGQSIEFQSNGGTTKGYLAVPSSGKDPALVVIQEWWGLVEHIKDVCDRFAAEGFVALAPDVYHGEIAKSPDEAGKLMMALRVDQAEKDIKGAVAYLLANAATTSSRVGIIGFCMGGALSLYAATKNSKVGACVVFYGILPNVKPDLANLECPVLGIYAERDGSVTPAIVRKLEDELKSLGKSIEVHIYPGTDHAFFNDTRPQVYNAEASADAWQRTVEFLGVNLV